MTRNEPKSVGNPIIPEDCIANACVAHHMTHCASLMMMRYILLLSDRRPDRFFQDRPAHRAAPHGGAPAQRHRAAAAAQPPRVRVPRGAPVNNRQAAQAHLRGCHTLQRPGVLRHAPGGWRGRPALLYEHASGVGGVLVAAEGSTSTYRCRPLS